MGGVIEAIARSCLIEWIRRSCFGPLATTICDFVTIQSRLGNRRGVRWLRLRQVIEKACDLESFVFGFERSDTHRDQLARIPIYPNEWYAR